MPNQRLQHTPEGARMRPPGLLRRVVLTVCDIHSRRHSMRGRYPVRIEARRCRLMTRIPRRRQRSEGQRAAARFRASRRSRIASSGRSAGQP